MPSSVYDPYAVVRQFEAALCEYTGAKYAATTTSCTMALLLACSYFRQAGIPGTWECGWEDGDFGKQIGPYIEIPKRTYISVPMSIVTAKMNPRFIDLKWSGEYKLDPLPVWDCARWFRKDMYRVGQMMCCSFHWTKHLAIGQGGCILHDNEEADEWLRRARFDGRKEGVSPKDDTFNMIGYHCYMSPRDAAEGLSKLAALPDNLQPLPNSDYPDLSTMEFFK